MSDDNFTPETYSPSPLVTDLHGYPHYNNAKTFDVNGEYWTAIEIMFYLTCMGGFACIVVQCFFFCFESCCRCCTKLCGRCSSFCMRLILVFLFMWLLAGTGMTYWGRNEFQDGSAQVGELADELRAIFNGIETKATALDTAASGAVTAASSSNLCVNGTSAQPLIDGAATLRTHTQDTLDQVEGLGPTVGDIGDLFKDRIPYLIDWGIGLVTAFIALTVFFGLWSVACGSTFRQKLMIAFSVIVLTVLCPLIAFELTLSVVISDFCVGLEDADASLMVIARKYAPDGTLNLIEYYSGCLGTNPLNLTESATSAAALNVTAQGFYSESCSKSQLGEIQTLSLSAKDQVLAIEGDTECRDINPYFTDIFYNVVCDEVLQGVYKIWVVQLACAVSLWVLLFFVQAEVLTREQEGRLELARQEQRLGFKPSSFLPKKGTRKRRLYDKKAKKELLAEDKKMAEELALNEEEAKRDQEAWALADQEAVAEAAAEEKRQWLVKNPKGFGGVGEERREETLRVGQGGAAAAAAAAAKKKAAAASKAGGGAASKKKRNAKRTYDPDAAREDVKKSS